MSSPARLEKVAEKYGLRLVDDYRIGAYTPSLWPMPAYAASGELAPGLEGTLALPRIAVDGGGEEPGVPIVLVHLPGTIARLPELLCRDVAWRTTKEFRLDTSGFKRLDHETIFESGSVERRYAVEHPADVDAIFLRRLFSPTFLDWLGDHTPPDLFFELVDGRLTVLLAKEGGDLGILWEAAGRIAERLRSESAENRAAFEGPFAEPLRAAPPLEPEARAGVDKVRWEQPPETVLEAADRYERHARGGSALMLRAFLLAAGLAGLAWLLAAADLLLFGDPFSSLGLVVAGLVLFWTIFPIAARNPRKRLAGEWGKLAFAEQLTASEELAAEDPAALHESWPELPLPGPARRLWRGETWSGRPFRLLLMRDASGTPGSSGYEALLLEKRGGEVPAPAGPPVQTLEHDGLLVLYRTTPLPSGATRQGLLELREAAERSGPGGGAA